jgi:hypothetical protein
MRAIMGRPGVTDHKTDAGVDNRLCSRREQGNRMRLIFCLALLTILPAASAAPADPGKPRQFIDQTIITYSKSIGPYRLIGADYDPAHVANGVSLGYTRTDVPGLQLNIYVYPRGRADESKAVAGAMTEIEAEIRAMERQKAYTNLQFKDASTFAVTAPDSRKPHGKNVGRKRALALTVQGTPEQSLAYAFYRNLFLISVRATTPTATASPADFNAVIDQAVQDLVPTIDIRNFGVCGNINISVDANSGKADQQSLANATQMVDEIARLDSEHCAGKAGTADSKPPKGWAQKLIVYPTGTWK